MKQMRYSEEQKRWALEQMKVPVNKTVKQLAKETGITEVTLRTWRDEAARKGESIPSGRPSEGWSSAQKLEVVPVV